MVSRSLTSAHTCLPRLRHGLDCFTVSIPCTYRQPRVFRCLTRLLYLLNPVWDTNSIHFNNLRYSLGRQSTKAVHISMHIHIMHMHMHIYIYYFVWRGHDSMPPCTVSRVDTNYERIASWGGCQWRTGNPRILETPLATHYCSQRPNHSAMTHPSKTDWHQPSGITQ